MNINTREVYEKALKAKFEEAKKGMYSGFLMNPSPAELKSLCLLLFDKGINRQDQEILNNFFELNMESDKRRQIEQFDIDKLRPIGHFLKGKTETTRTVILDMIAFLVDFHPRPLRKFMNGSVNKELTADDNEEDSVSNETENKIEIVRKKVEDLEGFKKNTLPKRMTIVGLSLLVFGSVSYGVKNNFFLDKNSIVKKMNHFESVQYPKLKDTVEVVVLNKNAVGNPKKEIVSDSNVNIKNGRIKPPKNNCMVWRFNHFEATNYDQVKDTSEVVVLNQELVNNFKKITVSDSTEFFKDGDINNPLVWYGKSPDKSKYEFFNHPGLHPETGNTLKAISKYIIKKYILKK